MESPKHRELKTMLYIVVLFGFSFALFYILTLDRFIVKISRLDLEILQNIEIMQSMMGSNITHMHGHKMIERSGKMKFESKGDIKALRKEKPGFGNIESNERQKMKRERQNIWSLNKSNLGTYVCIMK